MPRSLLNSVRDLFPNPGLAAAEWRKHGACTGLSPDGYFALTREAYERVTIPAEFAEPDRDRTIGARAMEQAFVAANSGLKPDGIASGKAWESLFGPLVEHWDGTLDTYRRYAVNHEVGHRLGHGHEVCPADGELSPVMAQQTYQLAGCVGNAWPFPDGSTYVAGPAGDYSGPELPPDDFIDR